MRNLLLLFELAQVIKQQLRSINGERGNHYGPAALCRGVDYVAKRIRNRAGLMFPVSIR